MRIRRIIQQVFRRGAAVAQDAVNIEVAGSNPAAGAKEKDPRTLVSGSFSIAFEGFATWASDRANLFRARSRFAR